MAFREADLFSLSRAIPRSPTVLLMPMRTRSPLISVFATSSIAAFAASMRGCSSRPRLLMSARIERSEPSVMTDPSRRSSTSSISSLRYRRRHMLPRHGVRECARAIQSDREPRGDHCLLSAHALFHSFVVADFYQDGTFLYRAIQLDHAYAQAFAYKPWCIKLLICDRDPRSSCANVLVRRKRRGARSNAIPHYAFVLAVAAHILAFISKQPEISREMF